MDTNQIALPAALGPALTNLVRAADVPGSQQALAQLHVVLGGQLELFFPGVNADQPFPFDQMNLITEWAERRLPTITAADLPAGMLPMVAAERVLGGLGDRRGPQPFLPLLIGPLTAIFDRYRILLRQFQEAKRRTALANLALYGNAEESLIGIMRAAYQVIAPAIAHDTFLFNIFNPHNERFEMSYGVDSGTEEVDDTPRPLRKSLSSWVVRHRQSLHFADLQAEIGQIPDIQMAPIQIGSAQPSRGWLGIPMLLSDGRAVGLVSAQRYEPGLFGEADVRFLTQVAAIMAVMVEKALLIEQRDHQIAILVAQATLSAELGRVRDVESALRVGMDALRQAFDAVISVILTFDPDGTVGPGIAREGDTIELRAPTGRSPNPVGFSGLVQQSRRPLLAGTEAERITLGMTAAPIGDRSKPSAQSLLAAPMIGSDGAVIGALSVQDYAPHAFSAADLATIEQMARQLALVLENARLIEHIQRQVLELQAAQQTERALQSQVRALSAPLVPIYEQIVVMPLVGEINDERAQQIIERLLEGVTGQQASVVLLDITGVEMIDTGVANYLIQAATACRLLGAEVIVTGIAPAVAQTLVHLGLNLEALLTSANLQTGLALALTRIGRRIS